MSSIGALDFCLAIGRAHASLNLQLREQLGAFHGLDWEDFRLLHLLLCAEGSRMAMADLSHALGLPMPALLRKMLLLEKTGLAERAAGAKPDNRRHATLRPGGRKLIHAAVTTAEAICADAVKSLDPDSLPHLHAALLALGLDDTPSTSAVQRVDYAPRSNGREERATHSTCHPIRNPST